MTWKNLPKKFNPQPSRIIDEIDLQAMSEGDSIRKSNNYRGHSPIGRRLTKMRKSETRGSAIIGNKIVTRFTRDHQAVLDKVIKKSE